MREFKIAKKTPEQLQREAFVKRKRMEDEEHRKDWRREQLNAGTLAVSTYAGAVPQGSLKTTDQIKQIYYGLIDKGESHYLEAINFLLKEYHIETKNAVIKYNFSLRDAYAITRGNVGDEAVNVEIGKPCFDKSEDFGVICRAIAHEVLHARQ